MSEHHHTHTESDILGAGIQRVAYYRELDRLGVQANRSAAQIKGLFAVVILLGLAVAILSIQVMFA